MTQVQNDLREVIALINTPRKWTKGETARTIRGFSCSSWSNDAVCWCLLGACHKITLKSAKELYNNNTRYRNLMCEIEKFLPTSYVWEWNDTPERTFEDIHDILNKALNGTELA
jgi:hypothetical protein